MGFAVFLVTTAGSRYRALFRSEDNLESPYARDALRQLYRLLAGGKVEGGPLQTFEDATGLKLTDANWLRDELPPITTFLNWLLALTGRWTDAASGDHGDLLDLIRHSLGLADFRDVAEEARRFLGLPHAEPAPSTRQRHAAARRIAGLRPTAVRDGPADGGHDRGDVPCATAASRPCTARERSASTRVASTARRTMRRPKPGRR